MIEEMLAESPMEVSIDGVLLLDPVLWVVGEVISLGTFG